MRYLLITYVRKADGKIDEQVTVSKRTRDTDLQMCNVILDYKEHKVVKSVIDGQALPTTWEKVDAYYRGLYPSIIERLEAEASTDTPE